MTESRLPIGNGERSGYRDAVISTIHRKWHKHLGFHDVDNMWVENTLGIPMAIVDYKKYQPTEINSYDMHIRVYQNVASALRVPYFLVFYDTNPHPVFTVRPMNTYSFEFLKQQVVMSECEYVELQFAVRRQPPPYGALSSLSSWKPGMFDDPFDFNPPF